ncbi:FtsX-like permease family protein [Dermabacteraceae bacterium TAE3-ERU27]|nr:FtsX-like permease family protein [Dermabacteraceae bacterium TAE3-ERU27]
MSRIKITPLRRHLAAIVTIMLASAFATAMILGGNVMRAYTENFLQGTTPDADIVFSLPHEELGQLPPDTLSEYWPYKLAYVNLDEKHADTDLLLVPTPQGRALPKVVAGSLPHESGEVALTSDAASQANVKVGETLKTDATIPLRVTGIVSPFTGSSSGPTAVTTPETFDKLGAFAHVPDSYYAISKLPPKEAVKKLSQVANMESVKTLEEHQETQRAMFSGFFAAINAIGLVFTGIAVVTGIVVVGNTFAVTVAQQIRSLAMLRLVGASRGRVRRIILRDSLFVGLIGSLLGAAIANLLAYGLIVAFQESLRIEYTAVVSPLALALPFLLGLGMALFGGLIPARAATKVTPLEALRPREATSGFGGGKLRAAFTLLSLVSGISLIGYGYYLVSRENALENSLLLPVGFATLGGALVFVGAVVGTIFLIRPVAALFAALLPRTGALSLRMAVKNLARYPRRSAATVSAVLIASLIMMTLAVGAATATASLEGQVETKRPFDVIARGDNVTNLRKSFDSLDDTRASAVFPAGDIELSRNVQTMTLFGASPEQVRQTTNLNAVADAIADNTVVLGADRAESFKVKDGQVSDLPGKSGPVKLTFKVVGDSNYSFTTPKTLESLELTRPEQVLIVSLKPLEQREMKKKEIQKKIDEWAAQNGTSVRTIELPFTEKATYQETINNVLWVAIVLLGAAVAVAIVGVANTLSLSVVERTGENALLRALGTSRSQIRAILAWEGILLSALGAGLGCLLGSALGVAGVSVLLSAVVKIVPTLPYAQLASLLICAVLAGLIASVIPGWRASQAQPATALANEEA